MTLEEELESAQPTDEEKKELAHHFYELVASVEKSRARILNMDISGQAKYYAILSLMSEVVASFLVETWFPSTWDSTLDQVKYDLSEMLDGIEIKGGSGEIQAALEEDRESEKREAKEV